MTGRLFSAIVAEPPAGDGTVRALIHSLDGGVRRHGPCAGWAKRADGRAPERGDACLVAEDETGGMWIVAWVAPGTGTAPGGGGDGFNLDGGRPDSTYGGTSGVDGGEA